MRTPVHVHRVAAGLAATTLCTWPAHGGTIHVPGDYPALRHAIDAAAPGDEIVVADGVYSGPTNRDLDFRGKSIVLRSSGGPESCVIDAGGRARAFVFAAGEDAGARVQGFTIRHGVADAGGAVYVAGAGPRIEGCVFEGNTADRGGAVYVTAGSPEFVSCAFVGNQAATVDGGAVYNIDGGHPSFVGCTFTANAAAAFGGAIFSDLAAFTMRGCTLAGNEAENGAGIANYAAVEMVLANCILWGNVATSGAGGFEAQIWSPTGLGPIHFCCIQDLDPAPETPGCIGDDPLLVDPAGGDVRLSPGSPCIDAGHNGALAGLVDTDLDGLARFADDPGTPDTGCGVPVTVDMGAYEYPGLPFAVRLGDLDGDGLVGVTDFLDLLAAWGPAAGPCEPADLDLDAAVGVADLLTLLSAWG